MNELVKDKKFLHVLDNFSKKTNEVWDTLKTLLPETTNGSKILLITRCRAITSSSEQSEIAVHQLQLRTKEESRRLFNQNVQFPPDHPLREEALKEVERCGGLPLAIEYLVDKISGKESTVQELQRVPIKEFQTCWSETVEREDLKNFLCYFSRFPKDFEIPARRLIGLWVAEQLGSPSTNNEIKTLEQDARRLLSELISLDMIQVVEKKIDGDVKTCRLPSALQELYSSKHERPNQTLFDEFLCKRLVDHFNEDHDSFHLVHDDTTKIPADCPRYVSFLSFDTREGTKPGEDIGSFLCKAIASGCFQELQVLDLERVFRPQLPDNIRKLTKLTYLGLRWTYLETIPSSIGDLLKLQTLDMKHTNLRTLPCSLLKLKELRHLYLNQIFLSKSGYQPSSLRNLQTLWGVFVGEDSHLIYVLQRCTNLRKLGLTLQSMKEEKQKALFTSVAKLTNLECLSLRSINEMGKPTSLWLESLKGLKNLVSVYLFGKLENPPMKSLFPESLSDLTFSASELEDDQMHELGNLSKLKSLCFYSGSYKGEKTDCSGTGFCQLQVLKHWKLENLEELDVVDGAMKNLRKLDIRSCEKLEFPAGLKHLKSLRELEPEEFKMKLIDIGDFMPFLN